MISQAGAAPRHEGTATRRSRSEVSAIHWKSCQLTVLNDKRHCDQTSQIRTGFFRHRIEEATAWGILERGYAEDEEKHCRNRTAFMHKMRYTVSFGPEV